MKIRWAGDTQAVRRCAYSDGSSWIDGSAKTQRTDVRVLSTKEALDTLSDLEPIVYRDLTNGSNEVKVGFDAETVPELVATYNREGVSPMEIVAVLTRIIQNQQQRIEHLEASISELGSVPRGG